jgi:hypothetical protein
MANQPLPMDRETRLWEEAAAEARREGANLREHEEREKREQERVKAEQEAIENKRRIELFVFKSTLPYSELIAQEICERISCGELLINICLDEHLLTMRRINQWLREYDDFNSLYKESLNDRLNIFEEQVIQIADDSANDFKDVVRNGVKHRVLDAEAIARAKLRVEVRFRHLKAGRPQKWGDSTTLNLKSEDKLDTGNLSTEELEAKIASYEEKSRTVRSAA